MEVIISSYERHTNMSHPDLRRVPYLPNELLLQIFETLDPQDGWARTALQSARLASRRTRDLATPSLFQRVCLHPGLEAASKQIHGLHDKGFTKYIRRLKFNVAATMPLDKPVTDQNFQSLENAPSSSKRETNDHCESFETSYFQESENEPSSTINTSKRNIRIEFRTGPSSARSAADKELYRALDVAMQASSRLCHVLRCNHPDPDSDPPDDCGLVPLFVQRRLFIFIFQLVMLFRSCERKLETFELGGRTYTKAIRWIDATRINNPNRFKNLDRSPLLFPPEELAKRRYKLLEAIQDKMALGVVSCLFSYFKFPKLSKLSILREGGLDSIDMRYLNFFNIEVDSEGESLLHSLLWSEGEGLAHALLWSEFDPFFMWSRLELPEGRNFVQRLMQLDILEVSNQDVSHGQIRRSIAYYDLKNEDVRNCLQEDDGRNWPLCLNPIKFHEYFPIWEATGYRAMTELTIGNLQMNEEHLRRTLIWCKCLIKLRLSRISLATSDCRRSSWFDIFVALFSAENLTDLRVESLQYGKLYESSQRDRNIPGWDQPLPLYSWYEGDFIAFEHLAVEVEKRRRLKKMSVDKTLSWLYIPFARDNRLMFCS